jgi:hypothetical protein
MIFPGEKRGQKGEKGKKRNKNRMSSLTESLCKKKKKITLEAFEGQVWWFCSTEIQK